MNYNTNPGYEAEDQYPAVQLARPEPMAATTQAPTQTHLAQSDEEFRAQLKAKYGKVYRLEQSIIEDDDPGHSREINEGADLVKRSAPGG